MTFEKLDDFCGSEFWNDDIWTTGYMDFTICFQKTILIWFPCACLWVLSFLDIFFTKTIPNRNVSYGFLNISKLFFTGCLILLSIVDIVIAIIDIQSRDTYLADYYASVTKIASFTLSAALLDYTNRRLGLQSSGLQFFFWLILLVCGIPQLRTQIRRRHEHAAGNDGHYDAYSFVSYLIFYIISSAVLLLNCYADKEPLKSKTCKSTKPYPEHDASFPSRLFFTWFDPFIWKGYRQPLERNDLWDMSTQDSCEEVVPAFNKYWEQTIKKATGPSASVPVAQQSKKQQVSIIPSICKTFGPAFLFGSLLKLVQDSLAFVSPQILKLLIDFVSDGDHIVDSATNTTTFNDINEDEVHDPLWRGVFYAVLLFIVASVQTLIMGQYGRRMYSIGLRVRTVLISAIYKKAMCLSNSARKESTVGGIINLMATDSHRFVQLTAHINAIWSAPLQIGLAFYFLWGLLGPSSLAGLAVMIVLIPFNWIIANKTETLQTRQMEHKDDRVNLMNEILNGIKVLKLYAWEQIFEDRTLQIREKELSVVKENAYLTSSTKFIWTCAPFLVAFVSFACFVLIDENNVLDAKTAFVALSLFNILRLPLSLLPTLISDAIQAKVALARINEFMNSNELSPDNVSHDPNDENSLVIENGTFHWGDGDPALENINLRVKHNSLVAIVGTVGAGKSSIISAFLGEMDKVSGRVNTVGSVAYVSQQAWIQNATLQDNILFGKPMDRKRYDQVIAACALKPDIEMLPGGDATEIGEKGINLSGGQKQRVSLARAVYNDADIYFLDDPLSAVDSHVGKYIFEHVIGPNGVLANKSRLLVTHGITYLSNVDNVYVVKDGGISESGSMQELMRKNGAFAEFLLQHYQEVNDGTSSEDSYFETISLNGSMHSNAESNKRRRFSKRDSHIEPKPAEKKVDQNKLIEQEKSEVGNVKWDVYKRYFKSINLWLIILAISLNIVYQGFACGSNIWLSQWANDKSVGDDPSRRDMYLGVYAAFGIGQGFAAIISDLLPRVLGIVIAKKLHSELLNGVTHAPLSFFERTPSGRVLSRFSRDIYVVDTKLPEALVYSMYHLAVVLATLCVISLSTYKFLIAVIPMGIVYYVIQRLFIATSRQLKRLESVSRSPIYSHFGESIQGATTIRAFNLGNRFIAESEKRVDHNQLFYAAAVIASQWVVVRLEMVGNLITLLAALFAVCERDTISAGMVGLSIAYALDITQTLNCLVRMVCDVETHIVSVERIKEYAETRPEAARDNLDVVVPRNWPDSGKVQFKNFELRYREGLDLVLKNVSFTVNGGEKVGIVGRTGAGKSSLTLALFRIIEAAGGSIVIDGEDISKLGLHTLRGKLTIIPQDPVLFSGSLRINLDPFGEKSDDALWRALELAHLRTFVKGLTAGLDHEVTEGGENLSVGQRQLICLSRALLRKTKVLILDEATAAVDLETDDLIQKTIRSEFADCTVLTIAHRLNTIMDSDKVIVLDRGHISEFDSPTSLLQNESSTFYSMAKDAGLV